jgi:hypothetical protein
MHPHRNDIWRSSLYQDMKQGSNSEKKPDSKFIADPVKADEGIDAFRVLQIIGGIICVILVVWIIFHSILHIF